MTSSSAQPQDGRNSRSEMSATTRLLLALPAMVKGYRHNRSTYRSEAAAQGLSAAAPVAALIPDLGIIPDEDRSPWRETEHTPVLCVHGTVGAPGNWEIVAQHITDRRLFYAKYGFQGTGPLTDSIDEVVNQITELVDSVGMPELVLLGHSRGALVSLIAASDPRVRSVVKVKKVIGLGGNFSGVPRWSILRPVDPGKLTLARRVFFRATDALADKTVGAAGWDQFDDSPGMAELLQRADREIEVVSIASNDDKVVPPAAAFTVPSDHVMRMLVQDYYPGAHVLHNMLPRDARVIELITRYLD